MSMENTIKKLEKLMSETPSDWREKAQWRRDNRDWLHVSGMLALSVIEKYDADREKIREALEYNDDLRVDSIMRGDADLTLSEIDKLVGLDELLRILTYIKEKK